VLGTQDLGAKGPSGGNVVTAGPWNARDSFIAETAVLIDRLTAKIERLERREQVLTEKVIELVDHAQQAGRFQALSESLRNSRDYKLDETARVVKDMRVRLDAIEGPRAEYNLAAHKSFIDVDRKLAELSHACQRGAVRAGRWYAAGLFLAVAASAAVVSYSGLMS